MAGKPGPGRGRPLKLTPEVQKKICDVLISAGTIEHAARRAGINYGTLARWRATGARQRRGIYRDFCEAVEDAIATQAIGDELCIAKAAKEGDWKAAAFRLERKHPLAWAPRVFHHVEAELSAGIERLKQEFADAPETLERAVAALAGGNRHAGMDAAEDGDDREDDPRRAPVLAASAKP